MIFSIVTFNKSMDMYEVASETGEKRVVNAIQIAHVMANGYEFNNAYLTRKGFAIQTNGRTKYIQLNNIPKQLDKAIVNRLQIIKQQEELKKQQMTAAIKKPTVRVRPTITSDMVGKNSKPEIKPTRVVYKGEVFLSAQQLCRKFNRDADLFKQLYNKGYSMDECLGLMPLRPESELIPRSKTEKIMDAMEARREV